MTQFFLGCFLSMFTGSFIEYTLHRLLHTNKLRKTYLGKVHINHHKNGYCQPWIKEWIDYFPLAIIFGWFGFLVSLEMGIGWLIGGIIYVTLVATVHYYSHTYNDLDFHGLHHKYPGKNFGVVVAFWDRILGTYLN